MSHNLKELMEYYGHSVNLLHNPEQAKVELQRNIPDVLIVDELNLKGCYKFLFNEFSNKEKKFHLIVLNYDGLKNRFPLADICMGMPLFPDAFIDYLSSIDTSTPFDFNSTVD